MMGFLDACGGDAKAYTRHREQRGRIGCNKIDRHGRVAKSKTAILSVDQCGRPISLCITRRNSGRHGHTGSNSMERASSASETKVNNVNMVSDSN